MPRKLNQILHISVHTKKIGNKDRAKVFSANPWPVFFAHWWQVQGQGEGFEDLMGWLGETFVGSVFGLCCGGVGGLWYFCWWWWWWSWTVSLIFSVGKIVMRRNQPQGCFYVRISMTGLFCYFAILAFTCFVILFTLLLKASLTKYQAFQIFAWFKISNWFWCRVVFCFACICCWFALSVWFWCVARVPDKFCGEAAETFKSWILQQGLPSKGIAYTMLWAGFEIFHLFL